MEIIVPDAGLLTDEQFDILVDAKTLSGLDSSWTIRSRGEHTSPHRVGIQVPAPWTCFEWDAGIIAEQMVRCARTEERHKAFARDWSSVDCLWLDLETRSDVPLTGPSKAPVYKYVESPAHEIQMCAWARNDGEVQVAIGEEAIAAIPGLFDPSVLKVAHNADFERINLSRLAGLPKGKYLSPEQFFDTAVLFSEWGYPRALSGATKALGGEVKDSAGTRLINLFAVPPFARPGDHPEEWADYGRYCKQDVESMRDACLRLGLDLPDREDRLRLLDCSINDRGVRIDATLAERCIEISEGNKGPDLARIKEITGVSNPNSRAQLIGWLATRGVVVEGVTPEQFRAAGLSIEGKGVELEAAYNEALAAGRGLPAGKSRERTEASQAKKRALHQFFNWACAQVSFYASALDKEGLEELLDFTGLPEEVREVLILRQGVALTSEAKFSAALRGVSHGERYRGAFTLYGAGTGRWTSSGLQFQNISHAHWGNEDEGDEAMERATLEACEGILQGGTVSQVDLGKAVRNIMEGPFLVADFSSIEARVLAWLAGESWREDFFRRGEGDIYCESASRIFGVPVVKHGENHELRAKGKVAELACGYAGGAGVIYRMGGKDIPALERQRIVDLWRDSNPNITHFWSEAEAAILRGGSLGEHLDVEVDGNDRYVWLPSGRPLVYRNVRRGSKRFEDKKTGEVSWRKGILCNPRRGTEPQLLSASVLTNNVTQATARDLLREAMIRLDDSGYRIVAHVHDEIICEETPASSLGEMIDIMRALPSWAEGIPVDADGYRCYRYRKG